jgi:two-component system chemotaxis sensor kinase CheA
MDVVREKVESFKGSIEIDSTPGAGCTLRLRLPITLATAHVLTVLARGQVFAIPVEFVESAWSLPAAEIFSSQGVETALVNGTAVSIGRLSELLELPESTDAPDGRPNIALPCIMLQVAGQRFGLLVDTLVDQQEVVQKPLGAFLQRVPNIAGATILGAGELCLILNVPDLMRTARRRLSSSSVSVREQEVRKPVVLLVEDSITTRTQEKRILEGAGYEVITAVDGEDGYQKLQARIFDAVVTDIEMPRLDGLGLTARIRADGRFRELPVILVTSLATDESRRRGAEVGANAYITKAQFDQSELLDALRRLV